MYTCSWHTTVKKDKSTPTLQRSGSRWSCSVESTGTTIEKRLPNTSNVSTEVWLSKLSRSTIKVFFAKYAWIWTAHSRREITVTIKITLELWICPAIHHAIQRQSGASIHPSLLSYVKIPKGFNRWIWHLEFQSNLHRFKINGLISATRGRHRRRQHYVFLTRQRWRPAVLCWDFMKKFGRRKGEGQWRCMTVSWVGVVRNTMTLIVQISCESSFCFTLARSDMMISLTFSISLYVKNNWKIRWLYLVLDRPNIEFVAREVYRTMSAPT